METDTRSESEIEDAVNWKTETQYFSDEKIREESSNYNHGSFLIGKSRTLQIGAINFKERTVE